MTKKKTAKAVEAVRAAVPAGTETKAKMAEKTEAKSAAKPAQEKVDKEAMIQGQVDANAAAILKAHDEGKSVKELYKMFGIDRGLFCDLVYVVLWEAGRLPKSKYAERVTPAHDSARRWLKAIWASFSLALTSTQGQD